MPMNIFPTNATNGQTVVAGGVTFTYVAATDRWVGAAGGGGGGGPTTGVITGTAAQDYQVAATAPTVRSTTGGGGALVVGDLYLNTTTGLLNVRTSSGWQGIGGGPPNSSSTLASKTTVFSGNFVGWYDLAQHGPGYYSVAYVSNNTGYPVYQQNVYYDGVTTFGYTTEILDTVSGWTAHSAPTVGENGAVVKYERAGTFANDARYVGGTNGSSWVSGTSRLAAVAAPLMASSPNPAGILFTNEWNARISQIQKFV